ncbi:hypothetical protein D8I24_4372 [Cupriavidus necator H850]|nr:hypothetical protein D8I24_4372 [Cupriavidus necator H850]
MTGRPIAVASRTSHHAAKSDIIAQAAADAGPELLISHPHIV